MSVTIASNNYEFERAEQLSALVYLNSLTIGRLEEVIYKIKNNDPKNIDMEWPAKMQKDEWFKLMDGVLKDEKLKALNVVKIEEVKESGPRVLAGHKAVLFADRKKSGYVVFRGTGSDEEWEDNAKGMFESDTIQQKAAARFVQNVKDMGYWPITVAGHSKGGNKAQYSAISLPAGYVDSCFSFDGQGFSLVFLEKYKEAIEKRRSIIHLASESRGFVHALGIPIGTTRCYRGRRGTPRIGLPHGDPLPYFHCPDALRDTNWEIGPESLVNPIPAIVNRLVTHFLKSPDYGPEGKREETALGLTSLMSHKKNTDIPSGSDPAAAIAELMLVFVDLTATDINFRRQVTDLVMKEPDVLVASLDAARGSYSHHQRGGLSDLGKKITKNLAHHLAAERKTRRNFIETIRFFIDLRHLQVTGKHAKVSEYIAESVHIALKILASLTHLGPVIGGVVGRIQKAWDHHIKSDHKTYEVVLELLDDWEAAEVV